ncbi:MAG: DUF6701 domain-containing protein [Gammaproteobacteria bacterium]
MASVAIAAQICTTASIGPNEFKGISGSSDSNVIAVGKRGDIQQFNGTAWSAMTSPTTRNLEDVEVVDGTTAFAVGKRGTILQLNGSTWTQHTGVTGQDLKGVWAASATEAYVVGKRGTLFSFNGAGWTNQSAAAGTGANDLEDAWGDANAFYALGKNGTLYRFNRGTSTWNAPDTLCSVGVNFKDLWGDGAGNLYLVGKGGVIYKHDGASCTLVATASQDLEGVYGSTLTGEIYAVGKRGVVMFFNGSSWQETTEGTQDLRDVWVSPAGNAYYAGKNGQTSTCTFTQGTMCTTTIIPGNPDLRGISGSSDSNVIAVGKRGDIQQFNGTAWSAMTSPTTRNLEDVEVVDGTTAFAVGKRGTILQLNGSTWTQHTGVTGQDLKGVWAASATEAYVVGKRGTLFSFNGAGWTNQSAAAGTGANDLEDAWGDANAFYALGKNGTLYRFNRGTSTWNAPDTLCSVGVNFKDLWGDGAGNLYLVGKGGVIYKHDGASCTLVATASQDLEGVYGSTLTGEIYAVGKRGVVMFFNGSSWQETTEGTQDLRDVWVSPAGTPYFAGKGGSILKCQKVPVLIHYAISYPNGATGVTCEASDVVITAHGPTHVPSNPVTGTLLTVTTSTGTGVWEAVPVSGTGTWSPSGVNDGNANYAWPGGENNFRVRFRHNTATTLNINLLDNNSRTESITVPSEDPSITFSNAAFRVTDAIPNTTSIGPQIAGKDSGTGFAAQTLFLQAVRTDTNTGSCVGVFQNQTVTIQMASECNNPTTCVAPGGPGNVVSVADNTATFQPIGINNNGLVPPAGTYGNVNLAFDAQSKAPLLFRYPDAGQITLHARYLLPAPPVNTFITGSSNAFVVRPFGFDIDSSGKRSADWLDDGFLNGTAGDDTYSADATGTVYVKAGANFNATVRAVVWQSVDDTNNDGVADAGANLTDNAATPNFGREIAPEKVNVTHNVALPTLPGNTGNLVGGANLGGFTNGILTTPMNWDEVGIIDLNAALISGNYLGGGSDVTATHANFGRFYPDRFMVTDNGPAFADTCTAGAVPFTYQDQTFFYGTPPLLTITALNTAGNVTQNYGDTNPSAATERFWKLTSTLTRTYTDQAGASAAFADVQDPTVTLGGDLNFDGIGTLALNAGTTGDAFMYGRVSEEGQFNANVDLSFTAATLTDSDGVCYDPDNNGVCDAYTITGLTGVVLRFGRLFVGSAVGSELLPLAVAFQTQYFNGTAFVANSDDSCTRINDLDMNGVPDLVLSNTIDVGQVDGDILICPAGTSTMALGNNPLTAGDGNLSFTAPTAGAGCTGFSNLTLDLPALGLGHLQYNWDGVDQGGDGNLFDDNPSGRATFGIFKGGNEFIYIREPWNN